MNIKSTDTSSLILSKTHQQYQYGSKIVRWEQFWWNLTHGLQILYGDSFFKNMKLIVR